MRNQAEQPRAWAPAWALLGSVASLALAPTALNPNTTPLSPFSFVPAADFSLFSRAGESLLRGDFSAAYSGPANQAGPLQCLLDALLSRAASAVGHMPVAFLAILSTYLILAVGVERVANALGPNPKVRRWASPAAVAYATLLFLPTTIMSLGHWWQLPVLLLWAKSADLLGRGEGEGLWRSAALPGLLLGLSFALEPWAILGFPVLLLARGRARFLWASATALVTTAPSALLEFSGQMGGLVWTGDHGTVWSLFLGAGHQMPWSLRLVQASVVLSVCSAAILLLGARLDRALLPLWFAVLVVSARIAFEVQWLTYYPSAAIVLTLVLCFGLLGAGRWAGGALMFATAVLLYSNGATPMSPFLTSAVVGGLATVAVWLGGRQARATLPTQRPEPSTTAS